MLGLINNPSLVGPSMSTHRGQPMIVTSTAGSPARASTCPRGSLLLASLDVEWTKNYHIRGGNIPFCYSVVYLAVPDRDTAVDVETLPFTYTSVYVEDADETQEFIRAADAELRTVLHTADLVTGHQFTSDLATLANAATTPPAHVAAARAAWAARRSDEPTHCAIDTRYDAGPVLTCASRRLVDVCTNLGLEVTQPELRGSMTAMHRAWLEENNDEMRERISVLNLRHSLSTALVALRATGRACWGDSLNVNRLLHTGLDGAFSWTSHPTFTRLLEE